MINSNWLRRGRVLDGLARRYPPLLVLVGEDVRSISQLDVVRGLRQAPETRNVPIAVLGGDAEAATAAGASLHVAKPLDYHALVDGAAVLLEFV